jgi:hypothetical protein
MTLSSSASRIDYAGNGSTTVFAFPNYFLADIDLIVVRRDALTGAETVLALGTDYTVAGAGASTGGTVTLAMPPATGQTLTIRRQLALVQETDFVANDPLSSEVLERAIDRVVMALQQQEEVQARTLQFPVGDSTSLSTVLPPSNVRASRSFGFNAAGEPVAVDPPVVSSSDLVVVASTAPGHQSGRLWIDTGTANTLIVKQSDGTDWTELWRVDTAANSFSHESDVNVTSADAGSGEGPTLTLDRASASPAASDLLGALAFQGRSTTGAARGYARLLAGILDPTNASEDGRLQFQTAIAGTLATRLTLGDRLLLAVALETAKGAAVASAATTDIWGPGDGTLLHVTGTTTITSFGTTPQAGAFRVLIFDAALTLTHGANLVLNGGGANVATAAGDIALVWADTTTSFYCYVIRASGKAVVAPTVQRVYVETGASATGITGIPLDDTIPQQTEGDEYMTLAVTPTDAANILAIRVTALLTNSLADYIIGALFQDSAADAVAAMAQYQTQATGPVTLTFTKAMVAGTTSATTFKFRAGRSASGTVTFNGRAGSRLFGGAAVSSIEIVEYKA